MQSAPLDDKDVYRVLYLRYFETIRRKVITACAFTLFAFVMALKLESTESWEGFGLLLILSFTILLTPWYIRNHRWEQSFIRRGLEYYHETQLLLTADHDTIATIKSRRKEG